MSSLKAAAVGVALVVGLSGCLKIEQTITVAENGTFELQQLFAVDANIAADQIEELSGESLPGDAGDLICDEVEQEANESLPSPDIRFGEQEVSPFRDGDKCGLRRTFRVDPSADAAEAVGSLFGAGFGESKLAKMGENWEFEVPFNAEAVTDADVARLGINGLDEAQDLIEVKIQVDLPGQAIDGRHNATKVDGGRFTWIIDNENPQTRLFAATEPSTGPGSGAFVVGGAIAAIVVGLGAAGWFLARGQRRPAGTATAAATASSAAAPQATAEPYFDEMTGSWVLDDPVHGRMWYHAGTGEWIAF